MEDFIENLSKFSVVEGIVWIDRTENPLDDENRREAARFRIDLHATAVCQFGDDGEFLLEYAEHCGTDYRDATQEMEGSDRASELRECLEEYCERNGLVLRPGVIDM